MEQIRMSELFARLKPFMLDVISTVGGGSGPFAPTPHDLSSGHHTGSLADAQAPQFLKTDGGRALIGHLAVAEGITLDGVDISAFFGAYGTHIGLDAATAHGSVGLHNHQNNAQGGLLDHGLALTGLGDDDHTQYAQAEGSGTRRAYEAGRLNKSVVAGAGLTGGGVLTADQTLNVGAGTGIVVNADDVAVNLAHNFGWTGAHTFNSAVDLRGQTTARHILPETTDTYDLGSSVRLWRKGWLSELDAILFTQNTVTLLGGWLLISKDEGAINADVLPGSGQVDFGKAMTTNDFVLFRAAGKVEYMQVLNLVSGTLYNVTRNLDGSGANEWPAGTPFVVLGQSGQGRIELNAYDTPRIQLLRQGPLYNDQTELIRIGDLNGNWGYTGEKWGVAIGEFGASRANLTLDQDGVFRIRLHAANRVQIDTSGILIGESGGSAPNILISPTTLNIRRGTTNVISLSTTAANINNVLNISGSPGAIAVGSPPPTSSTAGTGLWMDHTGLYGLLNSTRQAYFGNDGKFYAGGGNIRIGVDGIDLIKLTDGYSPSNSINMYRGSVLEGYISARGIANQSVIDIITTNTPTGAVLITATGDTPIPGSRGIDVVAGNVVGRQPGITLRGGMTSTGTGTFLTYNQGDLVNYVGSTNPVFIVNNQGNAYIKGGLAITTDAPFTAPTNSVLLRSLTANIGNFTDHIGLYNRRNASTFMTEHGFKAPVLPVAPWTVAQGTVHNLVFNVSPVLTLTQIMRDFSEFGRHFNITATWQGHVVRYKDKTVHDYIEYFGTNAVNTSFHNPTGGAINGFSNISGILWFHPNGTGGVTRGLVTQDTNPNLVIYINTGNRLVIDIFDTNNTQYQIISTNNVLYNQWNYVIWRAVVDEMFEMEMNSIFVSGTVPTAHFRAASGNFRLGFGVAAPLNGQLGWFMLATRQDINTLRQFVSYSRFWHDGGG